MMMMGEPHEGSAHHWLFPCLGFSGRDFQADARQLPSGGALQGGELVGVQEAGERVVLVSRWREVLR